MCVSLTAKVSLVLLNKNVLQETTQSFFNKLVIMLNFVGLNLCIILIYLVKCEPNLIKVLR